MVVEADARRDRLETEAAAGSGANERQGRGAMTKTRARFSSDRRTSLRCSYGPRMANMLNVIT